MSISFTPTAFPFVIEEDENNTTNWYGSKANNVFECNSEINKFSNNGIILGGGGGVADCSLNGQNGLFINSQGILGNCFLIGQMLGGGGGGGYTIGGAGGGGAGGGGAGGNGGSLVNGSIKGESNSSGFGDSSGGGGGGGPGGMGGGGVYTDYNYQNGGSGFGPFGGGGGDGNNDYAGGDANANGGGGGGYGTVIKGNSPSFGAGGGYGGGMAPNDPNYFGYRGYGGGGGGMSSVGYQYQPLDPSITDIGNGGYGILNDGILENLFNSMGGIISNPSSNPSNYGPLFYAGNAPKNYYLYTDSSSNYGQLWCTGWIDTCGNMNFDIDPSSNLTPNTYSSVVRSNLNSVNINNSYGIFNNYSWSLSQSTINFSGVTLNNYDLVVTTDPLIILNSIVPSKGSSGTNTIISFQSNLSLSPGGVMYIIFGSNSYISNIFSWNSNLGIGTVLFKIPESEDNTYPFSIIIEEIESINSLGFEVESILLESITPSSGTTSTNTVLTISSNKEFVQGQPVIVNFGSESYPNFNLTSWSNSTKSGTINFEIPNAPTGSNNVSVIIDNIQSNNVSFLVTYLTLSNISPSSGSVGSTTTLSIASNLVLTEGQNVTVNFGSISSTAILSSWSSISQTGSISYEIPLNAQNGENNVSVTIGDNTSNTQPYNVTYITLTSITPSSGTLGTLTILSFLTNLDLSTTNSVIVYFDSVLYSTTFDSADPGSGIIDFTIPSGYGIVDVYITISGVDSNIVYFQYFNELVTNSSLDLYIINGENKLQDSNNIFTFSNISSFEDNTITFDVSVSNNSSTPTSFTNCSFNYEMNGSSISQLSLNVINNGINYYIYLNPTPNNNLLFTTFIEYYSTSTNVYSKNFNYSYINIDKSGDQTNTIWYFVGSSSDISENNSIEYYSDPSFNYIHCSSSNNTNSLNTIFENIGTLGMCGAYSELTANNPPDGNTINASVAWCFYSLYNITNGFTYLS